MILVPSRLLPTLTALRAEAVWNPRSAEYLARSRGDLACAAWINNNRHLYRKGFYHGFGPKDDDDRGFARGTLPLV